MTASTSSNLAADRSAGHELLSGISDWHIWATLAWFDIKQRYRRSVIGPFWLTISTGILIGTLGFLWSSLFKMDIADYLPFFAVGQVLWTFIATSLTECCSAFIQYENIIKQARLPYPIYILRVIARNGIILAHNAVIIGAVMLLFPDRFQGPLLWLPLGLVLVGAFCFFSGLLVAILCTRFRDLIPLIQAFLQIVYFITPILWKPDLLSDHAWLVSVNPFAHLIEMVRAPFIGGGDVAAAMVNSVLVTASVAIAAVVLFRRLRHRIVYWL